MLSVYLTVSEFLVAFRAAQNPSGHLESPLSPRFDGKRSRGLGISMKT